MCFWKDTLRNKNRCENSFHFFVFSMNAFEKPTFDDGKNCKNRGFHVFYQFSVTQKPLPGYLILGTKTDIWASRCGVQKFLKSLKKMWKKGFLRHLSTLSWKNVFLRIFDFSDLYIRHLDAQMFVLAPRMRYPGSGFWVTENW